MNTISRIACVSVLSMSIMGCFQSGVTYEQDKYDQELAQRNSFHCNGMMLNSGINAVEVHKLHDGKCYPVGIFSKPTAPDLCKYDHFHYPLLSLDGVIRGENDPNCGSATTEDIAETGTYYVTSAMAREWNQKWRAQTADLANIDFSVSEDKESAAE